MLTILLIVGFAMLLSTTIMRKALPFESLMAVLLAGMTMVGLLLTGRAG
jgi:hypothetical protein